MKREFALICIVLLGTGAFAETKPAAGSIHGTVFAAGSDSEPTVVPGAQVKLSGTGSFAIQADAAGKYSFDSVPPGLYRLEVTAPGLTGANTVQVAEGEAVESRVDLAIEEVKYSVTVSADAAVPVSVESAGRDAIGTDVLEKAPNKNDRLESMLPLIPGVVRGPDGLINMKGTRSSQGGALINGANATDPVTGIVAARLPIDVVSSVQVISNPYDPEYGKLTGAVSTVDTRTGNYEGFHASVQNVLPRPRKRDGAFVGLEAVTPRMTLTGPIVKDKLAFTQSLEYRFVRTPVNSLPQLQRDTKLESIDSYSQMDWSINQRQSATVSFAIDPQKLDYLGLNTFTPQVSTPNLHQRGHMASIQHRYITGTDSLLVSQFSSKRLDADVTGQSDDPYRILLETTQGGFYNRQHRETERTEWQETYHFAPVNAVGSHQVKAGFNYVHNAYDGRVTDLPADIIGANGYALQRITFGPASQFNVAQHETAWFVSDKWQPLSRLTVDYGLRLDHDSITHSTNAAPRAGLAYALTRDNKTILKAGAGLFYDRVILNVPVFPLLPGRTVANLDAGGQTVGSVSYTNVLAGEVQSPRSAAWNVELDRQILEGLVIRIGYQQRNTSRDFVMTPTVDGDHGVLSVSNDGLSTYREFQVTGRYKLRRHILNASYVHSQAFGNLNDLNQFLGNTPQVIIQADNRARLPFDAPNRFLFWGEFAVPGKITFSPVVEFHSGFPYSLQNQQREYVGERSGNRFPGFASVDAQVTKELSLPLIGKAKAGFSVFNLMNHYNPREVQNNIDSENFGAFYNGVGRTVRGKFVVEF